MPMILYLFLFGAAKTKCKDPNYRYNPFSGKCVRLEKKLYKWAEADSHCKSKGETLVTVDSAESAFWIRHQFIAVGEWNMSER